MKTILQPGPLNNTGSICIDFNYVGIICVNMNTADITGTIGVGLILSAYFCFTFGWIDGKGRLFFLLNIIGAALACYASLVINYWPFVILEGTWVLVSLVGFGKTFKAKK